ncbi:MAG: hypothetical protein IH595_01930 [Bacteroidales bacterium]|nr:hypothetical protein [Bacteroidales bacterium]
MEEPLIKNRWSNLIQIMFISLIAALFAFVLLRLLSELTLLYFSYDLNIQAALHLKSVHFLTKSASPDWTRDSIITIFLSRPFMNLILALIGMIIYAFVRRKSQAFHFFLIWLIIFALGNAFGTFAENGIFKTGTYEVTTLMNFGSIMMLVVVMISFYFLYLSGVGMGRLIMLSMPDEFLKNKRIRFSYYLMAYLVPWLLTFLFIFTQSDFASRMTYLFGLIILIPVLWTHHSEEGLQLEPLPPLMWIDVVSSIFYFIGIYLMYTMLATGIRLT